MIPFNEQTQKLVDELKKVERYIFYESKSLELELSAAVATYLKDRIRGMRLYVNRAFPIKPADPFRRGHTISDIDGCFILANYRPYAAHRHLIDSYYKDGRTSDRHKKAELVKQFNVVGQTERKKSYLVLIEAKHTLDQKDFEKKLSQ